MLLVAAGCGALHPRARVPGAEPGVRVTERTTSARGDGPEPSAGSAGSAEVPELDLVAVVELLAVAVEAGSSVPHALGAVGAAAEGRVGSALARAGSALLLGTPWSAAWSHAPALGAALDGLAASWTTGAASGPALRGAAAELRRGRDRAARESAGRLTVRLVLPLGLCFLPAFVLIGLVPVLASLAEALLG